MDNFVDEIKRNCITAEKINEMAWIPMIFKTQLLKIQRSKAHKKMP